MISWGGGAATTRFSTSWEEATSMSWEGDVGLLQHY